MYCDLGLQYIKVRKLFKGGNYSRAIQLFIEIKMSFLRLLRPNFGLHLVFKEFSLEFSSFFGLRKFDLGNLGNLSNLEER